MSVLNERQIRRIIREEIKEISIPDLKRQKRAANRPGVDPLVSKSIERNKNAKIQANLRQSNTLIIEMLESIKERINKSINEKSLLDINNAIDKYYPEDVYDGLYSFTDDLYTELKSTHTSDYITINFIDTLNNTEDNIIGAEYIKDWKKVELYLSETDSLLMDEETFGNIRDTCETVTYMVETIIRECFESDVPFVWVDTQNDCLGYGSAIANARRDWCAFIEGELADNAPFHPEYISEIAGAVYNELFGFDMEISDAIDDLNKITKKMAQQYK